MLCHRRASADFLQLALNLRTGERSTVRFLERGSLDGAATLRKLLAHRACNAHPNVIRLQVGSLCNPACLAVSSSTCLLRLSHL